MPYSIPLVVHTVLTVPPCNAAHAIVCSNACRGSSSVFMVVAHAQPTIRLANTSVTNAVYAKRPSAMRT